MRIVPPIGVEPTRPLRSTSASGLRGCRFTTAGWCTRLDSNQYARRQRLLRPPWLPLHHECIVGGPGIEPGEACLSSTCVHQLTRLRLVHASGVEPLTRSLSGVAARPERRVHCPPAPNRTELAHV